MTLKSDIHIATKHNKMYYYIYIYIYIHSILSYNTVYLMPEDGQYDWNM